MKPIITIIALVICQFVFGQFAVISDNDGYVNVRSSTEKSNNISDKLSNGKIVYCFEPDGNWINIDYKKDGKELNGYIYKDRIKYIADFIDIPLKSSSNGIAKLYNKNIKVEIRETKFIKEIHTLAYFRNNPKQLNKIDNSQIFGTDGEMPKKQYKSIDIQINDIKIGLPKTALKNLYEPNLFNSRANYDEKNDILYITSSNSDGAGGYEIIWVIEKKKYKNRIETYGF